MLAHAFDALAPGGIVAAEDIDYRGQFCDPSSAAFDRYGELYVAAARSRGCDPWIGARLGRLLEAAGFSDIEITLAQPFGRNGDAKHVASLTFAGIADILAATRLASAEEIAQIGGGLGLAALAVDPGTTSPSPASSRPAAASRPVPPRHSGCWLGYGQPRTEWLAESDLQGRQGEFGETAGGRAMAPEHPCETHSEHCARLVT
jgi:hypothetical protein